MLRKAGGSVLLLVVLILGTVAVFNAAQLREDDNGQVVTRIPDQMKAGTIIEFDENNRMKIIVEGEPVPEKKPIEKKPLLPEQKKLLEKEERMVQKIREEAKDLPVYHLENPAPEPGMRVIYDGEGLIKEIIYPQDK